MISFAIDLVVFILMALAIVGILLLYVGHRTGWDWERFKNHWTTTGDGAVAGIIGFIVILALFALLAFGFNSAQANWFEYTEIYAGVEQTKKPSPQCKSNYVDDRLTSNGGVRQHIYSFTPAVSLLGNYTHHSCAVGVDAAGYDAFGVQINWRFNR